MNIEVVKKQIVNMKALREAENAAFLQGVKEDEEAIALLMQAKEALFKFYTKNKIEIGPLQNFLQQGPEFERSEDEAPETTFSDKGHRSGESKGIISVLTMIIEDLGAEITEALRAEEAAQLQFEENEDGQDLDYLSEETDTEASSSILSEETMPASDLRVYCTADAVGTQLAAASAAECCAWIADERRTSAHGLRSAPTTRRRSTWACPWSRPTSWGDT